METHAFTHLKRLEAESIHIIREVTAEFENPVMLYSIGKDSAVMLHLARKAFAPGKPPFPLLHVDTTWKFREMIAFRDSYVKEQLDLDLIVHINAEGVHQWVLHARHEAYALTERIEAYDKSNNIRSLFFLHAFQSFAEVSILLSANCYFGTQLNHRLLQ